MSLLEKYKPKFQKNLIISQNTLSEVKNWISSLDKNPKQILCNIGPIGCGKTLTIDIFTKNFNKFIIDIESIKQNDIIDSIISYKDQTFHGVSKKKNIVIIENIEHSEKQVVSFIEKLYFTKNISIPIILLSNNLKSNDSLKELPIPVNLCYFQTPNEKSLNLLIENINKNENLKLSSDNIKTIISKSLGDLRQVFSILDSWILQLKVNQNSDFNLFNTNVSCKFKDIDLMEKLEYLINEPTFDFDKSYLVSSCEAYPVSLGIYQNYTNQEHLSPDYLSKISDALSYSNLINNSIYNNQCWELYDYSIAGCVIPSFLIKQNKLENIDIKQFKDISYNFENSLNEIKTMILQNNYDNKIFKSETPNNIFTNIDVDSMFSIIQTIIICIEKVNNNFDSLKKGKNTSKKEKLELAQNITEPLVKKPFDYLIDTIFNYRLFELDWQYLRLNITQLQEEKEMIEYYEKIDLRIFKRLINIFSLSKTNKLLKSHTETALKFNLCKRILSQMKDLNLNNTSISNIEDMTQSLSEIWKF
jgi:hypothetical protein